MRAQQRLHVRFTDVGRGAVAYVCVLLGAMGLLHGAEPPSIENVRHTEDYGYLKTAESKDREALAPWGSLKFIPLNQSSNIYLTLGAEFRLRYERYDENNWGDGPQDDDGYLWARVLPLADLHIGNNLRFFGQFISSFAYDLDMPRSPVDEDRADVMQAFAEVRFPFGSDEDSAFTLRPGRQLLTFGSGRLIDVRYGPNVLQTFDAVRAFVETDSWRFDAFYAQPVKHRPGEFDDRTDQDRSIWSLYGTVKSSNKSLSLDAYYIGYQNKEANFGNAPGRELRHTFGSRLFGEARGWDWNYEASYQFGGFETKGRNGNISAWSVSSDTGYTFEKLPLSPRLALKADIISGDDDPNDVDVQTFNPLFPKGKYWGELSPVGPANLIHINPYATLQLTDTLQLTGNVGFYWRESTDDGIYGFGGMHQLRAGNGSKARFIGTQAEVMFEYQVNRHLSATTSYSIFTAGEFIKETGPHNAIHLFAMELVYRF